MPLVNFSDTVIAPATCEGMGAISVLRISGKSAFAIASKFMHPAKAFQNIKPRQAYMLEIKDGKKFIDQAVVLFFKAPKSYTGEDMAEIFCHGSPYILRKVISLAISSGARQAEPGEFTLRAFVNGKMDLAQAEAINDLILSENEAAHEAAARQLKGHISSVIRNIRKELIDRLSEIEVRIDDPDEEIEKLEIKKFLRRLATVKEKMVKLAASFEKGRLIKNGIRVSIIGAANSGKSSLFNALLGYNRAIVTHTPGTTTDVIEEKIILGSLPFIFADTAGINSKTADIVEREGIMRAKRIFHKSDILIWVKDISTPFTEADNEIKGLIATLKNVRIIKVLNKSDLPQKFRSKDWDIVTSCKTGRGIEKIKKVLIEKQEEVFSTRSSAVITSMRHCQSLKNASSEIGHLIDEAKNGGLDIMAERLRGACAYLGEITGEITSEELLQNIFSKFCVGK